MEDNCPLFRHRLSDVIGAWLTRDLERVFFSVVYAILETWSIYLHEKEIVRISNLDNLRNEEEMERGRVRLIRSIEGARRAGSRVDRRD